MRKYNFDISVDLKTSNKGLRHRRVISSNIAKPELLEKLSIFFDDTVSKAGLLGDTTQLTKLFAYLMELVSNFETCEFKVETKEFVVTMSKTISS